MKNIQKEEPKLIFCGEADKFYRCVNCDTPCGSEGHFIEEPKQENCCTPVGQIKRYIDCIGCDCKPKQELAIVNNNNYNYVIETNKQETLEEVAEIILLENTKNTEILYRGNRGMVIKSMLDIAKWQQEQDKKLYSDEEVLNILIECSKWQLPQTDEDISKIKQWFEKYKNK